MPSVSLPNISRDALPQLSSLGGLSDRLSAIPEKAQDLLQAGRERGRVLVADGWWHVRNNPNVLRGAVLFIVAGVLVYFLSMLFSGDIMPNVRTAGINLGGMSLDEAEITLNEQWSDELTISLIVDNEPVAEVQPAFLGMYLDAQATAESARDVGLSALPFGASIPPTITVDYLTAQNYLLDLRQQVDFLPYEAGFEWQDGQLVGVMGRDGRLLDVPLTIERMEENLESIIRRQRLELLTVPVPPEVRDPSFQLEAAREIVEQTINLVGYDPYLDVFENWTIQPEIIATWLKAAGNSLALREEMVQPFVEGLTDDLNTGEDDLRYIASAETLDHIREAVNGGTTNINIRIRYRQQQYEIQPGDTGYAISRKMGIPLYEIEQVNPGVNWNALSIGQIIALPTRDVAVPETPVPNKRIVVSLDRQELWAFEGDTLVFNWAISSGRSAAPTAPGIYQILNHAETAYGSSNTLCNEDTGLCGQWEMNWFMGIYEVVPGLINGFHGGVLLPNGNQLIGVGQYPSTFGCVMSHDADAQRLYEWAEVGTIVEIVNQEFAPLSTRAQSVINTPNA